MQTANHMEQAKSFLSKNALRAVPLALMAVAAAHAGNNPGLTFSIPNSTNVTGCSGSNAVQTLGGLSTSSGRGLSLYGAATAPFPQSCDMTMVWSGTGSGPFYGSTGTINASFNIVLGQFVSFTGWSLVVKINGVSQGTYGCTVFIPGPPPELKLRPRYPANTCTTNTVLAQTFALPATLSNWEVDLTVQGASSDGGDLTVNVPGETSIDLLAPPPPNPVPALTPLAMAMAAILLLCLAGAGILRRTSAGGFPGQPS